VSKSSHKPSAKIKQNKKKWKTQNSEGIPKGIEKKPENLKYFLNYRKVRKMETPRTIPKTLELCFL
jgi:hypothetical protein